MSRPRTGSFSKALLSAATISTPKKIGNVVDKTTAIHRSFSCRTKREEASSPNNISSRAKREEASSPNNLSSRAKREEASSPNNLSSRAKREEASSPNGLSCKTKRNEETKSSTQDNHHWSKIRRMTKELYFSKQMEEHLAKNSVKQAIDKNNKGQSLKKDRHFHKRSKSPAGNKDSKHWSKVRTMTKAGFFSAAKIIPHPPSVNRTYADKSDAFPTNKSDRCDIKDNSPPVSARQSNTCNEKFTRAKSALQKDRSWKPLRNEVIVDKALKGILKEKYCPSGTQTTNIKYIDIASGKQIVFKDLVRSRRISSASDSSRSTFNDAEGHPKTSYTVGQESKFINTVNIIQKFDVPKKELQSLNMKKMSPFKYVYVLSKCLPQFICKNYRPTSIPSENDPIYNQRLHENQPSSRPSTPASPTNRMPTTPDTMSEQNLVSA